MPNPYLPWVDTIVGKLLDHDPERLAGSIQQDRYVHLDADNEWFYRTMAGFLSAIAYAYTREGNRWHESPRALKYLGALFDRLVSGAHDDRWYHGEPGKGDRNIDRFTVLPFMEAYLLTHNALPAQCSERAFQKIKAVLQVQYHEYGRPKGDDNPYPNMDAYYCLIMLHGCRLTGLAEYREEFLRFFDMLERAQFEEGAWTYINGTNECPVYHDINVVLMGRIWDITHDARALRMIARSTPYYPQVVAPSGFAECFTDPWWKHPWRPLGSWGPDIVASLTRDGQNRWIGNCVREMRGFDIAALNDAEMNYCLPWCIYAAMLWQDGPEDALELNTMRYDKNIEGPRGRFAEWSWAATARYGSDTIVGAMSHDPANGAVTALMGITPEIAHQYDNKPDYGMTRFALGMTPPGTRGKTNIKNDCATFEVDYPMACFRSVWGQEAFPFSWECRQRWRMNTRSLAGLIEIVSCKEQQSPPPLVRIRWGRNLELKKLSEGHYAYGPFHMCLLQSDFPRQTIESTSPCRFEKVMDASELILRADSSSLYRKGETYTLKIDISYQADGGRGNSPGQDEKDAG